MPDELFSIDFCYSYAGLYCCVIYGPNSASCKCSTLPKLCQRTISSAQAEDLLPEVTAGNLALSRFPGSAGGVPTSWILYSRLGGRTFASAYCCLTLRTEVSVLREHWQQQQEIQMHQANKANLMQSIY